MKKLILITVLCFIAVLGFSQKSDSTYRAMVAIQPPSDAVSGEIYCYCLEYLETTKSNPSGEEEWERVFIAPEINKKGKYILTNYLLTGLKPKTLYIVRVVVYYSWLGYYGYGKPGQEILLRFPKQGNEVSTLVTCRPLN